MIKDIILCIFNYIDSIFASKEMVTVILAALPVVEARYAIPISYVFLNMSLSKIFILSLIGNMIPVAPLLLLLEPVSKRLTRFRLWADFFNRLEHKTRQRAHLIKKYETLGLILFVSIPLPITGAWTGAFAATLFKLKFKNSFLAILCGVTIASLFVSSLTVLGRGLIWLGQSHF